MNRWIITFLLILFLVGTLTAQDQIIRVTGHSVIDPNALPSGNAKLMAKRAAMLDGYRQILEHLMGIQIDSQTKVKDFVAEYDEVQGHIEGWLRGMEAKETRFLPDNSVEVDIELNVSEFLKFMAQYHFFEVLVWPGANVFLVDSSGSMTDSVYHQTFRNRWEMASYELKRTVNHLRENGINIPPQQFGVVFFSDGIKSVFPMTLVSSTSKAAACGVVSQVQPYGATNYYHPLETAIQWLKSLPPQRKTIYLLGDGEPNRGPSPYWEYIHNLAQTAGDIKIHVIYCGSADASVEAQMRKLAEITGGIFKKN